MEFYKLRVDTDEINGLKDIIVKYCSVYLIAQEDAGSENPHCHAYLETNTKQATLRNVLRKNYGSGNSSYSLKALDEQCPVEYLAYCVKQNTYIHNLPDEVILRAKEYDKKVKIQMKEKKKNRKTILQRMKEEFKYEERKDLTYDEVITDVIKFYKDHEILIRENMIVSQVQTLLIKYVPSYSYVLSANVHKTLDKARF